jgi:diguanylate cyclase (GGDEF)-like protein
MIAALLPNWLNGVAKLTPASAARSRIEKSALPRKGAPGGEIAGHAKAMAAYVPHGKRLDIGRPAKQGKRRSKPKNGGWAAGADSRNLQPGRQRRHPRRLEQSLKVETARLSRTGDWLSVIMLDIDFFKQFNDAYGHPEGDRCIAMIAAALNRAVRRASDLTARYGGEEFACVLPGTDHEAAMIVANAIIDQVRSLGIPHRNSGVSPYVTVSVGIATAMCVPGMTPDLWIKTADNQLYVAKAAGRNNVIGTVFEAGGTTR